MPASKKHSLKGYLLLDSGQLQGSFFQRTVVLVCQHDSEGAFGLVLNKPEGSAVGDILLSDVPPGVSQLPVFVGGPVQPTAFTFLHGAQADEESAVVPGIAVAHSVELLNELAGSEEALGSLKMFTGYSGWSPGQLDDEMSRGAWLARPATPELVFGDPENLWRRVLISMGWKYKILAQMPENPEWN
jgi:putative transcriptional regulator